MKTFEIRIKTRAQADAEFAEAFRRREPRGKGAVRTGVSFTSLEAVRTLLTDKRMALLHLIRERAPRSINQLAALAGRDFKNVHQDVMLLKDYGLVQLSASRKARKTTARAISVPYEAISIHARV